jgi:Tn3 transposase DDE domain/Phage integrase family
MPYQYVREPLTTEEADRLAAACEAPTEQLIVWTLLDTGLRVSELCALTSKDILWQQRQLRIKGKGGPHGKKTKVRVVPMSRRVRALREYGRVAKTLFIPRYLGSEAYRRRIGVQLNKGEALHALRRFLFFAHQGQMRRGQPEDQANQASCLNLLTNAVIAWNTVYMGAVIDRLRAKRERIDPEDLAHLSPARYDHINPYGRYQFRVDRWAGKKPLRPIKV